MKKHLKHAKIERRNIGEFHQNEFAILGTPCGEIKKLSFSIIEKLKSKYKVGYVDADHKSADEHTTDLNSALSSGARLEYVDKINFNRFDINQPVNSFDYKQQFESQDLVIVNGNHFKAKKQIIVIDQKKPLEKKLKKLTNVTLVLFQIGETNIPEYLESHIPEIKEIPKFQISDIDSITDHILNQQKKNVAPLNGLVLAGGKSERMQRDKGKIDYHGVEQRTHMNNLLSSLTEKSFISIRNEQKVEFSAETDTIEDVYFGLGPYGAILSAFQKDPNSAWLVTACDQPLLNKETLEYLIASRNTSKEATAFYNSDTDFPEPLITIWEPKAYSRMLYFLSLGYSCPRKVLINSDIELVRLADEMALKNANTPEEYDNLLAMLK
jgi:molybdopterin-guanine dinucleotide biosynthesis protein A